MLFRGFLNLKKKIWYIDGKITCILPFIKKLQLITAYYSANICTLQCTKMNLLPLIQMTSGPLLLYLLLLYILYIYICMADYVFDMVNKKSAVGMPEH